MPQRKIDPPGGPRPELTPALLTEMNWQFAPPLILEAALQFRLFDMLEENPCTAGEVSQRTGTSERGLRPILNALVAMRLLERNGVDRYALTPSSRSSLISTKPGYQGAALHGLSRRIEPWLHIAEAVASGRPVAALNRQ